MFPSYVPGNLGPPTTDDTRDATARFARGLPTQITIPGSPTQQLLSHNSFEARVVRCQLAPGSTIPAGFVITMIVEHGIDGGVTLARATLNEWGIAVQVPAGQIKVSLEIVDASGAGVNPSTIGVFTSVASGFLRERRVPVTIPTNAPLGTVFQPPPFAAVCDAWYLGPLGGSMTIIPAVTNVALALDAGNIPRTTFEACPVSILGGAGNGAATLDWIIYE